MVGLAIEDGILLLAGAETTYDMEDADDWITTESVHGIAIPSMRSPDPIASATAWSANRAVACPIEVSKATTLRKSLAMLNSSTGNWDVGIYRASDLGKIVSTGSFAGSAALVENDITDTPIDPEEYYLAIACDVGTTGFFGISSSAQRLGARGCFQMDSAFPLPSTLTPAVITQTVMPLFGFSKETLVA